MWCDVDADDDDDDDDAKSKGYAETDNIKYTIS